MGACASIEYDLSATNGGYTATQCADGQLTTEHTTVKLQRKIFSLHGNDFRIEDQTGAVRYIVGDKKRSAKPQLVRDAMVVYDPNGNKVAFMQRKLMAMTPQFVVYTYKPNASDQVSKEKDDEDLPLFRFALVRKRFIGHGIYPALMPVVEYYLYDGNEPRKHPSLEMRQQLTLGFSAYIAAPTARDTVLGHVGQTKLMTLQNEDAIELAPGMDLLGMICFSIGAEEFREKKSSNGMGLGM